ncbi:MAG: efflux RND transporter periplasmic adaptor subunit [Roseiflexaceae bacterium]|nr:efflux RND transporter periplasmic adaptor subunit [Roseiflexaceae bacterium]
MHNRIRFIAPVIVIALIAGAIWWRTQGTNASASGPLHASGTIEAEQVLITSEIAGRVRILLADEGQEVLKDAPLVQLDTALLEAQLDQSKAAVAAAQANLALLKAGARDEEIATAEAQRDQAKAARDGAERAAENAAQIVANPQELELQIAQAQAARDAAQAALRKLRAGSRAEDVTATEAAFAQAQLNLQATRDKLSAGKTQAEAAMNQATDALTQAQARYAQAKFNWEYVQDTGKDPIVKGVVYVPDANPNNPAHFQPQVSQPDVTDGTRASYYSQFVQAQATMHQAEEQLHAAQVGYDALRQGEASGVSIAEEQVRAANATLAKIKAGPTREDRAQAETALASAQHTLDTLLAIRENPQQLKAARDTALAQLAAAEATLRAAEARLAQTMAGARSEQLMVAEAQLAQANAARNQVTVQLAKASLSAPRDGLVLSRPIHEGEQVSPGAPLMTIGSLNTVRLTLYIAEADIGRIRQGQQVEVSVDSFPNKTFNGTISFIAQEAQFTPRNVQTQAERVTTVFAVRVELPNPDHSLKPGMPADAVLR